MCGFSSFFLAALLCTFGMATLTLHFLASYRSIEFGNFEEFSTTLGGVSFVKFPIDEAVGVDEILAGFPSRSV
jgi:hypothetical protein